MVQSVRALSIAAAVAAAQLAVFAGLAATGHWGASAGDDAAGAVLTCATAVLIYAFARLLAGARYGIWAAALWIAAPVLLLRYWVAGGTPPVPYSPTFHHEVLPVLFGVHSHAAVLSACLLLAACALTVKAFQGSVTFAAAAGVAAAGAALAEPSVWPALAAPALAVLAARRPVPATTSLVPALVGLAALALFRNVPGIHIAFHPLETTLADVREFSWSLRLLEYLPLAGLIGYAKRFPAAAVLLGWLFLFLVVLSPHRGEGVTPYLIAIRPGLPVYALLAAGIPLLVPSSVRQVVPKHGPAVNDP